MQPQLEKKKIKMKAFLYIWFLYRISKATYCLMFSNLEADLPIKQLGNVQIQIIGLLFIYKILWSWALQSTMSECMCWELESYSPWRAKIIYEKKTS